MNFTFSNIYSYAGKVCLCGKNYNSETGYGILYLIIKKYSIKGESYEKKYEKNYDVYGMFIDTVFLQICKS